MKGKWIFGLFFGLAILLIACMGELNRDSIGPIPDQISYNFHVRPILSDKCYNCHGPDQNKRKAGLRLDFREDALTVLSESPGKYAIVPGNPDESELIRRVTAEDPSYHMPPPESHLDILSTREIGILVKWIEQGAIYEKHWAFTPPIKAELPKIRDKKWPKNEIDYFVLAQMSAQKLKPNPKADKEFLLKRIHLDISGLLPSIAQMDAFTSETDPNAYEDEIDRLLETPQYGEKMALYWLDIARYSDSYGYQDDNIRSQWPYRDWVIHAFNTNMPYDQFIRWQLAGDMILPANPESQLATAFLRNHKYTEEGGVVPEEYRVEYVIDKVKTFSKGLLGLTAECAQCHDHKYDPISQKDYYRLFGFFNNSREQGYEGDVSISKPAKTPMQTISDEEAKGVLAFINKQDTGKLTVSVMEELDTLRPTFVLRRGAYDQPSDMVKSSAPPAVMDFDSICFPSNRLGLAEWSLSRENPLTARCFVNHIWQEFFGRGLVSTPGDFGMQGSLPSHPELLDWLAVDFMDHGWNVKRLVKQILMSSTYQQSAKFSEKQLRIDPDNVYLSRAPRLRLKAEIIRDMLLATSELLVKEIGGPSVKPYQPAGLWEVASSGRGELRRYEQDKGDKLYRRGIYSFIKLTLPPPYMMIFDASNRDQCEVKRAVTNTPLQALILMNDPTALEAARVFAQRLQQSEMDSDARIETAFRTVLCRKPNGQEKKVLENFYLSQIELYKDKAAQAKGLLAIGEYPLDGIEKPVETLALMKVISTLYNMEEAITRS